MEKVLIIVGDATETVDTLYPYYRLIEAGFEPVVAAPEKRRYQMVLHEVKPGWTITKEWEGYGIEADVAFADIDEADYLGIFFSGGRAPEYIRYDQDLLAATRHFFEANKPVAVVCHGVEIVAAAGVIEGRRMTTVAKCEYDITQNGGIYVNEPVTAALGFLPDLCLTRCGRRCRLVELPGYQKGGCNSHHRQ